MKKQRQLALRVFLPVFTALLILGSQPAGAQETSVISKIATYQGADRTEVLLEGARKEGTLTFYSAMNFDQAIRPLVAGFEALYPFMKVQYVQLGAPQTLQRLLAEARSKTFVVDVVETVGLETPAREADLNRPFWSPALKDYPVEHLSPNGYWAPTRLSYVGVAYNTNRVSATEAPQSYTDLLDPKWKGKMAWTSTFSGAMLTITSIRKFMGEDKALDYLQKLSTQSVVPVASSSVALLDQVIAGEHAMSLDAFLHHPVLNAIKGAPIAPKPMDPVLTFMNTVMLPKAPPHPYSAMLFIDYLLSEDGQARLRNAQYFPANPKVRALQALDQVVPRNLGLKENFIPSEQITAELPKSREIYQRLFVK